ncbi:tetratricopeptide repeat protein [Marinilactibacillus kalidii]|uniref:tetratricopeptide repeat protein n=1 Tax=Marinilactibacillus kalidii TaxID=2820274 RepID=UPI001ABE7634|nr:tetratricopeptide repeat protein [Marinilactibacillus kalidii]
MRQADEHQVISLIPSARTYYGRAMIAYEKKDFKKAEKHFKTGLSLAANIDERIFGNVQLALIYQHSFEFEKSIAVLNDVLENESKKYYDIYFFQATNYIHLEDYETAKAMLDVYRGARQNGTYSAEADEMKKMIEQQLSGKRPKD